MWIHTYTQRPIRILASGGKKNTNIQKILIIKFQETQFKEGQKKVWALAWLIFFFFSVLQLGS